MVQIRKKQIPQMTNQKIRVLVSDMLDSFSLEGLRAASGPTR